MGLVPIGGRSTAIRLTQSTEPGIFVYASSPLSPATKAAIEKLSAEAGPDNGGEGGKVRWLVTPDGEHGMYIQDWKNAFPDAKYVRPIPIRASITRTKSPHFTSPDITHPSVGISHQVVLGSWGL